MIINRADPLHTAHCGVGDYTFQLSQMLVSSGHSLQTVTDSVTAQAINVPPASAVSSVKGWGLNSIVQMRRIVAHWQPDVVHLQYQPGLYNKSPWLMLYPLSVRTRQARAIFVTTFHTLYNPSRLSPTRLYARALLRFSDGIIATNASHHHQALQLARTAERKILLLPVGTNIALTAIDVKQRLELRRGLDIGEEGIIVTNFGFPRADKGLHYLLESLADLRQQGLPVYFVHIGEVRPTNQAYYTELKQMADRLDLSRGIRWLGNLPENDVSAYLQSADIYAAPYTDGFSSRRTSAIVALAHGLPTITTHSNSWQDDRLAAQAMKLVPPGDVPALSEAIGSLARDAEERQRLSQASRTLAMHYGWADIVEQHAAFYQRVRSEVGAASRL
jgi:glycosyltransferase involved in cell wall biosynthesis